MLPEKIQSTVFKVDIVAIQTGEFPSRFPVNNGTHRLRIREIATVMSTGCFTGMGDKTCKLESPREEELDYEVVPAGGSVTITDHSIKFDNAGLRVWTKAVGLEERGEDCSLVSNQVLHLLISLIKPLNKLSPDTALERRNNAITSQPLGPNAVVALADCLASQFSGPNDGNGIPNDMVNSLPSTSTRVFDFHAHVLFDTSVSIDQANTLKDFAPSLKALVGPAGVLPANSLADVAAAGRLQPLIWFPFGPVEGGNEAFAFGAITNETSLRLFGRLGSHTDGFRTTDANYWMVSDHETRILTFREDIDPFPTSLIVKHAEFDAGALFPGDVDLQLMANTISLWLKPVPFYIGAMPTNDPHTVSIDDTQGARPTLTDSAGDINLVFLAAEVDAPIVFDPVIACGGC